MQTSKQTVIIIIFILFFIFSGKYAEEHSAELDEQLIALAEQQIQQNDKGVDNDKLMSEDDRKDNTDVFEELIKLDETSVNDTAEEL